MNSAYVKICDEINKLIEERNKFFILFDIGSMVLMMIIGFIIGVVVML